VSKFFGVEIGSPRPAFVAKLSRAMRILALITEPTHRRRSERRNQTIAQPAEYILAEPFVAPFLDRLKKNPRREGD